MAAIPDYRTGSPVPSSGRASPVNPRLRFKEDDASNKKDKVNKRWASAVERVLATFDASVDEWADYISFLGRLLKALQTRPPNAEDVPYKLLVAKRLAQCLSPNLPSGVHQKALEVYTHIFSFIGEAGLSRDISLYLPGLAPLISFASLSVKPLVLSIYEQHLVKCSPVAIRPALKALVLSLLPALEEENSDEYERALHILDAFKARSAHSERRASVDTESARDRYFWQCLFLATITSPSRRSGALAYLVRMLPTLKFQSKRAGGDEEPTNGDLDHTSQAVAHPDPGLLIRCFCAGLQDESVLVQRGFLDLLVDRLPLGSSVLQKKAADGDLKLLIMAATTVVLRRDMSLNRRLWAWLLGPNSGSDDAPDPRSPASPNPASPNPASPNPAFPNPPVPQTPLTARDRSSSISYFTVNALPMLVEGLDGQLGSQSSNAADKTRTLRICLALMDRFEIGNSLIPHIFIPALSSVQAFQLSKAPKSAKAEVLRSGNAFFDSVESFVIWHEIVHLIDKSFAKVDCASAIQNLTLVGFLLSKFNVREEDMQNIHLPLVAIFTVQSLHVLLLKTSPIQEEYLELIALAMRVVYQIIQPIPLRALAEHESSTAPSIFRKDLSEMGILAQIKSFYSKHAGSSKRLFPEDVAGSYLSISTCNCLALVLKLYATLSRQAVEAAVSVLDIVFRKVPWQPQAGTVEPLVKQIRSQVGFIDPVSNELSQSSKTALALTLTSVLEVLSANENTRTVVDSALQRGVIPRVVEYAWFSLSPGRPQHHVEASRCLWRLHAITSGTDLVESTIVSLGTPDRSTKDTNNQLLEHAYRFTVFWQQSQGQSDMSRNKRSQVVRVHNTLTAGKLQLLGRPLFQMLDTLLDSGDDVGLFVGHWLEELSDLAVVVNVVLAHMDKATRPLALYASASAKVDESATEEVDLEACIYFVRLLDKVVHYAKPSLQRTIREGASEELKEQLLMRIQLIVDSCLKVQTTRHPTFTSEHNIALSLRQACLTLLEQALQFLSAESLTRLKLDSILLEELQKAVELDIQVLQISLTKAASAALKRRFEAQRLLYDLAVQATEAEVAQGVRKASMSRDRSSSIGPEQQFAVPAKVLHCILSAFSSSSGRPVLDCWYEFLKEALDLYGPNIFQIILPLNECFCRVLRLMAEDLKGSFSGDTLPDVHVNEMSITQVLNALERPLEIAHGTLQDLIAQENGPRTEQQASSFFGMVSVLAPEGGKVKTSADNNRLTVLLCFKDALRVCFEIWSIDESSSPGITDDSTKVASFKYTTLRLRNRTRRIVEHLFQARSLECVETLVSLWHDFMMEGDAVGCLKVLSLLGTVETARPKVVIPALFNAIYSRTHPAALDPTKRSSLTSDLSEVTLTAFCTSYIRSLEDDATDEIWQSCLTFLRDVLTSPLNHRQILVQLLEFCVELGSKIDNTNFGEQQKMRRELGDLFIRLVSAITTIRPPGTSNEQKKQSPNGASAPEGNQWYKDLVSNGSADLVSVLAKVFPRLTATLLERDRVPSVASSISMQILGPTLKSKLFPDNIDHETLELLKVIGRVTEAAKTFKKDVSDAFNDAKFFSSSFELVPDGWLPVLRQWAIGDKERLPELFSRLTAPASAGIMFGVGASSARLDADRKTQLTLRRIATILIAGPQDAFVVNLPELASKIVELLNANAASSPSLITRADLYLVIRAVLLRFSPNHLNPLWPVINSEISDALSSAMPNSSQESLNADSLLQLCKLVDTLLLLNFDEFQLQEWLFITDTTDAVYRQSHIELAGLTDLLAESFDENPDGLSAAHLASGTAENGLRKPLLINDYVKKVKKGEYLDRIFRPFFRQLSIASFEGNYGMDPPDVQACADDLVQDLFDHSTLV